MMVLLDSEILDQAEMAELLHAARFRSDAQSLALLVDKVWNHQKLGPNLTAHWPTWWDSAQDGRFGGDAALWSDLRWVVFPVPSPLFRAERSPYEQALALASCKAQVGGTERFHIEVPPARVTVREPATAASAGLVAGEWRLIFRILDDQPPRRYRVTQVTETRYQIEY